MDRPECGVKGCENSAMIAYGGKWICGGCMVKIMAKRTEKQAQEIEDIGVEDGS